MVTSTPTRIDPPSPPSPPTLPSLSLLADATPHFHTRPPNATIPTVRVSDHAKVGLIMWLMSERLWGRVVRQRRPRDAANVLYDCIVDNHLQRTPPRVVKLGDRITLSESCMLEIKTVAESDAFRASVRGAANLLAMVLFAGRPRASRGRL